MSTITRALHQEHADCDAHFSAAEAAVSESDWDTGRICFARFKQSLEAHLAKEEQVLFPEFERRTGMTAGPTAVMRQEHEQMRWLLEDLESAVFQADAERFLGLAESLMILIQQHNMKEENMLYPMADRAIPLSPEFLAALAVDPEALA
ncbi:hypothetical protein CAI21_09050 [Alkalilimnicola ehrlichii]|uniref:Hemerythrin-like domain-containing protein n=1 Tax=Alkalilimnicola ehrlichii TaxID=351052 RepID=A0A3E0WX18_9GAMM|nr:hemerythrin domain-containing protein [Alkalilimnicola ehrlichii]RFA29955.1 hypothetical protein CAI21_09050 [Alkalilimnicola ehrlichii]RFA36545.1 hypothetical protein CAL65_11325 [Alkalilimnicola ehrlichii]